MLDKIIEISKTAGSVLREGFGKNFQIEYKGSLTNLVTEYDKKSEKVIIDFVKKEFPTHTIIAEESGRHQSTSEFVWVIDPLDGTTNFAHGLPIFSVSIGVLNKNEVVAGVVYDVMSDTLFAAEKGSGSYQNSKKLSVSVNPNLAESLLVTGFPYDIPNNPNRAIEKFAAFLKSSRAVRRLGSAAIDLCYVASGVFDGFWEVSLHPWDIAAGKLIVEEAGGLVTNFDGKKIDIFSKEILATNVKVHNQMLDILKRA